MRGTNKIKGSYNQPAKLSMLLLIRKTEGILPRVTCPELKAYLQLDDYVIVEASQGLRSLTSQHHLQAAYLRRACHFH